jgi:hypothetical protein
MNLERTGFASTRVASIGTVALASLWLRLHSDTDLVYKPVDEDRPGGVLRIPAIRNLMWAGGEEATWLSSAGGWLTSRKGQTD